MKMLDEKAKKLLKILVLLIVGMILLFFIVFIVGKIKGNTLSFSKVEEKMVEAAKKYYSKNKDLLPQIDSSSAEVDASILASEGYIKSLESYTKCSCSGHVSVTKNSDSYSYIPILDCGKNYKTKKLYDRLISSVVTEGEGLYQMAQYYNGSSGSVYVFRGEYPKNYVLIDKKVFRIVKINSDGSIMLIDSNYNPKITEELCWDNRYNSETNSYDGINDFNISRIKKRLDNYYIKNSIFKEQYQSLLISRKVCIGGRSIKDVVNDGSIECSKMSTAQIYFSLLQTNDFINASLDSNCKAVEDKACSNYNYLNKYESNWWLLNINSKSKNKAYMAQNVIYRSILSENASVRVVINLNKDVSYSDGIGTKSNPYIIK